MSCPKCEGFVIYTSATPVALEYNKNYGGVWGYFEAECEDCGWTGYGRIWYKSQADDGEYEDDVKLPEGE